MLQFKELLVTWKVIVDNVVCSSHGLKDTKIIRAIGSLLIEDLDETVGFLRDFTEKKVERASYETISTRVTEANRDEERILRQRQIVRGSPLRRLLHERGKGKVKEGEFLISGE